VLRSPEFLDVLIPHIKAHARGGPLSTLTLAGLNALLPAAAKTRMVHDHNKWLSAGVDADAAADAEAASSSKVRNPFLKCCERTWQWLAAATHTN
jgi:hypothetical protein